MSSFYKILSIVLILLFIVLIILLPFIATDVVGITIDIDMLHFYLGLSWWCFLIFSLCVIGLRINSD